jgi:hypothetical protein
MNNGLEVIIDGKLIDVVVESLDLDYRIMDLATLGTIESDKSLPLFAPFTQANNRAFGHLNDFAVENDKPLRKLPAVIMQDGLPIVQNATARITKTSQGYEIEIGAGNFSLFDAIKDLKLGDLDWSEYDHFWTIDSVYDSRNNTSGYIYLASDYFKDAATAPIDNIDRTIRADYLYPAVYVHSILDKIGEYTGIKLTGDLLDTPEFESLVLPFTRREFTRIIDNYYLAKFGFLSDIAISGFPAQFWLPTFISSEGDYFSQALIDSLAIGEIRFGDFVDVRLDFTLLVDKNTAGSGSVLIIIEYADGVSINQTIHSVPITQGLGWYTKSIEFSVIGIDIPPSFTIQFQSLQLGVVISQQSIVEISKANIRDGSKIIYGDPYAGFVTLASSLPDMSCGDLLKGLGNMFGLLYQYDEASNTVKVERFKKLYENKPIADDWTDKIDLDSLAVEYELGNYGRINRMVLNNPDELDRLQGSFSFTIDNEHLAPEKEVFKLPFQYTESVLRLEDLSIARIPILAAEEDDDNPGQYLYSFDGDSKPRILIVQQLDCSANNLVYYDGTNTRNSSSAPVGYFYQDGASFNLDLPSLIRDWNAERIAMLQKSRKGNLSVALRAVDIASLDFFKPVYIRIWAKYFAKHKVNRRGNGLSSVELVEM